MTIQYKIPRKSKQARIAPIPLARPKVYKAAVGESHKYKLRTNPTDERSSTYELTVQYFSTGTCEEWLLFRKNLNKVIKGLHLTKGPTKFELASNLLTGDALSIFKNAQIGIENFTETNESFETCLDECAYAIFPSRAELYQKRYMRRSLAKPDEMTMREFMSRIQEINEYFPSFPPDYEGNAVGKLTESELVEIGEFAIPEEWQDTMHLHNVDPLTVGVSEFIEFCERLETLHRPSEPDPAAVKRKRSTGKTRSGKSGKTVAAADDSSGEHYCMLHGYGNHSSEDCYQLKAQAKRMKSSDDGSSSKRHSKSRTHKSKYNRSSGEKQYSKQELNTMVNAMVNKALKGSTKKRKRNSNRKVVEELNQFEELSISTEEKSDSDDSKSKSSSDSNSLESSSSQSS